MIHTKPNVQTWSQDVQINFTVKRGFCGTITSMYLEYVRNREILFDCHYNREKTRGKLVENDYDIQEWYERERARMFVEVAKHS